MRVLLCDRDEVPQDGVTRVEIEGYGALAVYCVGGRFHASDDRCTHAHGSLSEGIVHDGLIECPLHGGTFAISTGEPVDPPCVVPLRTYPVTVEGGQLYADLDEHR